MRLISLGQACEVGFEIRMHTHKSDSDYFDWLITPYESLMHALDHDFEGLLDSCDLYRQEDKNFVINRRTGIHYGHVFMRDEKHEIPDNFLDDLPRVRDKFAYLKQKFHENSSRADPVCFIRRDLNAGQASTLGNKLAEIFPALRFRIACVNAVDRGISNSKDKRLVDLRIAASGNDGLGHTDAWAAALVGAGLTDRPFQKTKEDIVIPFH